MPRHGVRYYRALPPPREEWDGDFAAIADAGLAFVVLPVPWSLGHVYDDTFDFAPLVDQLALAERRSLDVVVAVDLTTAPAWLTARHPEYLHESATGAKALPRATPKSPCGGWPGLCFDNGTVRSYAGRFLRALARAVAAHGCLAAYDVSDCWALQGLLGLEHDGMYCQCAGSRARFIAWLRRAYAEDLDALGRTWGRRLRRWAEVSLPFEQGQFPDVIDWVRFHRDTLTAQLRWCVEALREVDPDRTIVASGEPFGREEQADGPALATEVSEWGCHAGDFQASPCERDGLLPHEAIDHLCGMAPTRKLWLVDLPVRDLAAVRRTEWSLLCAGADTVVHAAWRPDRNRAETMRPALARPDGSASPRLEAVRAFDLLAADHPDLAAARRGPPEVAVVLVPETQVLWGAGFRWALAGPWVYHDALDAACRAFAAHGARTVLVRPEDLADQPLAYVPMPFAMGEANARALRGYVQRGGHLVAEACLALFDEHGLPGRVSPGRGLDELFGARAVDVAETVREHAKPTFKGRRASYPCALRCEPLEATTGKAKATFPDGTAAVVDHSFGAGATRLIGTCPSYGCCRDDHRRYRRVILDSLAFAKVRPRVTSSSPDIHVALLERSGTHFLVAFNPAPKPQQATVRVSRTVGTFRRAYHLGTGKPRRLRVNALRLKLPPDDGVVLRLEPAPPGRRWPERP